ncbi:MAG: heme ABC transporter ATP-binding protein CcmA [Rhodospirillaceae bacterium]|nr:heme ABC transporter ATP-binding protein CcmA [Rhodospirillaceae bacterium]|tara:strand:+ start:29 stop:700 length:672 start_codon:yes stop_codon:yes gene_type:complete
MHSTFSNKFTGKNITAIRGGKVLLTNLGFEITGGNILILKGANGSGKSTLLRLMTGMMKPFDGHLNWNDTDISTEKLDHYNRLNYVGHLSGIKSELTAEENLRFWLELYNTEYDDDTILEALDAFNLSNERTLATKFLSSGQKRKLALTRLVARSSPLWLLDEPTVGLDEQGLNFLESMLEAHCESGGIAVIATHDEINIKQPPKQLRLTNFKSFPLDSNGRE